MNEPRTHAALAALIPGADPEHTSVVVTETTPDGARHTWSGTFTALADRIEEAPLLCDCGAPVPAGQRRAYCSDRCRWADDDHGSDYDTTEDAA